MRFIKTRNKEPDELSNYRKTPGVTYDDLGGRIKAIIRESLLDEQGFICAYCMGRIYGDTCTIEHYISQNPHEASPYPAEEHKRLSLLYSICVEFVLMIQHIATNIEEIPH